MKAWIERVNSTLAVAAMMLPLLSPASVAQTTKNEPVETESSGATEDEAIANGIKDILDRALESIVGDEAAGDFGDRFYAAYGNDPNKLRQRYFTSDFQSECKPAPKSVHCIIEAEIKFAALDYDVKKLMQQFAADSSKDMIFAANVNVPSNPRNDKLVTAIGREFETSGHRFEIKSDLNFHGVSMKITDIRFVGFKYDSYAKREDGAVDVNFELWYVQPSKDGFKAERIAADVATVNSYILGTDPDVMAVTLETRLITAAARDFVQRVNSQIVDFMQRK